MYEAAPSGRTLVLGLGNSMRGDDGVGEALVEGLRSTGLVPPWVRLCSAYDGDVLEPILAETWHRIVVIDAADLGQAPGTWMQLGANALPILPAHSNSHRVGLIDALGIGQALGKAPERLAIFAVQPESVEWGPGLTDTLAEALGGLIETVLREVGAGPRPGGRTICTMPKEQATHVREEQLALG